MNEDKDNEINELKERISCLEAELHETQTHLKKYTAPASRQVYYERHKEKEKQRSADYRAKTNYKATPEQIRRWKWSSCFTIGNSKIKTSNVNVDDTIRY